MATTSRPAIRPALQPTGCRSTRRDQAGGPFAVSADPDGCEHTLTNKSIAIQKGVTNLSGAPNGPGDTLEYALSFQVSDFFAFDGVEISDVISDGQQVDAGFVPTLEVAGNGFNLPPLALTAANYDVVCNYSGGPGPECTADDPGANDGTTELVFRLSDELVSRGRPLPGQWIGGCVDPAGGTVDPDCGVYDDGPTTAVLRFRTVVQEDFTDSYLVPPNSGDSSVDQGDVLDNGVTIDGFVLNTDTLARTGSREADTSGAGLQIGYGELTKTIFALNGAAAASGVEVKPGDELTYRLRYQLPTSNFENLELVDYLPLPIFLVGDPDADGAAGPAWSFDNVKSTGVADVPGPGEVKLGPNDTSTSTAAPARPAGYRHPAGLPATRPQPRHHQQRLRMYFGDFNDSRNQATTVDLLFTVTVSSDPFADRLFLTNQVQATEGSTNAGTITSEEIVQIVLTQPVLRTTKGVIWTSNDGNVFDPDPPGPVTFLPNLPPTNARAGWHQG